MDSDTDSDPQSAPQPLFEALERAVGEAEPREVAACLEPGSRGLFDAAVAATCSDEGALWVPDRERSRLVPVHHRGSDELQTAGFLKNVSQAMDCGLISMVFAGGSGLCENRISDNPDHSKDVDRATGRETGAMIAVPVRVGSSVLAVATAVKIIGDSPVTPYQLEDLSKVETMAFLLGELLELRLIKALVADV